MRRTQKTLIRLRLRALQMRRRPTYFRPGDVAVIPRGKGRKPLTGIVAEINFDERGRRRIRLEGGKRFYDELMVVNRGKLLRDEWSGDWQL